MQTRTHEQLVADFLAEIETAIRVHTRAYRKDAFWYQLIVVASAISGLLSLILGTAFKSPAVAGIFGGATTIATVLTQTLHCVKAQGWQDRMKSELEAIRLQLVYEHASAPKPEELAELSRQYRDLTIRMSKEWERIISSQAGGLNLRLTRGKRGQEDA